jgi:hypothetical protein
MVFSYRNFDSSSFSSCVAMITTGKAGTRKRRQILIVMLTGVHFGLFLRFFAIICSATVAVLVAPFGYDPETFRIE